MPRLPTSGASVMTPCREESELGRVLSKLCPGITFDEAIVHKYYMTLASLIGGWLSEHGRLETSPVKKALLTMAKDLSAASVLLSGLETGLRTDLEIEITSRVQKLMALDPTIGPLARDRLSSFRRDADCISHGCLIAAFDLPSGPEKRGAKAKDWYHSFTALLLTVAENAGIGPTLYKDRETNQLAGCSCAQPGSSRPSSRGRCALRATSRAISVSNAARSVRGRHDDKIPVRANQICRRVNQ
jgi:hypothetical protein